MRTQPLGVGFDIDHTLCIDNKLERVAFLHLLELVLAAGGRPMGSLAEESQHIDELLMLQRGGAFSIDDAVRRFVLERGVAPKDAYVERYRELALEMVDAFVVPAPDAIATLEALQERGYRIAILSNGWSPLQARKARRAGFSGTVLASGDLGVQKPDPRAFEALAKALDLHPSAVYYVGDDPRVDVAGALHAGLHAIWLDAEGVSFPDDIPPAPNVIGSLTDLALLLPDPVHA